MTPEHKHIAGLELVKQQVSITSPLAAEQLEYLIAQAKAAPEPGQGEAVGVIRAMSGGAQYASLHYGFTHSQELVGQSIYTAAAKPDADLIELLEHAAMHVRQTKFAPFTFQPTPQDRGSVALCARIDAALAKLNAQ